MANPEENIISLMDENDNEEDFEVVATLNVKEREYAILLPVKSEEESAYIFRIDNDENDEEILVPIEEDDEFDAVREEYERLMED